MPTIFLTSYFLLLTSLAVRRLDLAVMFLIAALPSYLIRFKIFGVPTTLLEVMVLIVFAVWFLKNFLEIFDNLKRKFKKEKVGGRYPFDWEMAAVLIVSFIAAGIAGFNEQALGIWKAYFFEPLLLYLVVLNVFRGIAGIKKIVWSFLVSALVVSAFATYQQITGQFIANTLWAAAATRRVVSFYGYPNAVGLYLGPLILVLTGWLIAIITGKQNKYNNQGQILIFKNFSISQFFKIILLASAIILSLLSVIFAKSVGGLFGVAAGLIVFGMLAGKKSRWATLFIVLIAGAGIISWQPARQLTYKYITLNDFSGQVRRLQWQETWKMLKDGKIITGAGLTNYRNAVAPYHQEGFFYNRDNDPDFHRKTVFNEEYRKNHWQPLEIYLYPHNIFLNFWTELGLAGMILFIWIIVKFYYLGIKI